MDGYKAVFSSIVLEQIPFGIRKQQNKCRTHFTFFILCNFNAFNTAYITKSTKINAVLWNCKEYKTDIIILYNFFQISKGQVSLIKIISCVLSVLPTKVE